MIATVVLPPPWRELATPHPVYTTLYGYVGSPDEDFSEQARWAAEQGLDCIQRFNVFYFPDANDAAAFCLAWAHLSPELELRDLGEA